MDVQYFKLCSSGTGAMTKTQVLEIIAQLDVLILSLLSTALKSVANGNIIEYEVDTGQTKNRMIYSKASDVTEAIKEYKKIRNEYQAMLSPRVVRMVPSTSMVKRNGYGNI